MTTDLKKKVEEENERLQSLYLQAPYPDTLPLVSEIGELQRFLAKINEFEEKYMR